MYMPVIRENMACAAYGKMNQLITLTNLLKMN